MRAFLLPVFFLLAVSSYASPVRDDPRNTPEYRVLFDIGADGKSELVKGFGAYIQVYLAGNAMTFRFCSNFEGKGLDGRPNPLRMRMKLVPLGAQDGTAYLCHDYSPKEIVAGIPLVRLGSKSFFAMRSETWSDPEGGVILFRFAKKIPLIGGPTYRTLRMRATRSAGELAYVVEAIIPRGETLPAHFLQFAVSQSGFGLPNGITALTLDPSERSEKRVEIDGLEDVRTAGFTAAGSAL